MKLRVYIDTSVFSALLDERAPARQTDTRSFLARLEEFEVSTSTVTRRELEATPGPDRRAKLLEILRGIAIHQVTDEVKELARSYLDEGVFASKSVNDALHVAVAVLTRHDVLVSWNFEHLVNRRRRARVNDLNISRGLPGIEIVAPPEM